MEVIVADGIEPIDLPVSVGRHVGADRLREAALARSLDVFTPDERSHFNGCCECLFLLDLITRVVRYTPPV
jgi:hypothetical protein